MKAPALILSHAAVAALGWAFMTTTFPAAVKEAPRLPSKTDRSRELSTPARELLARIEAERLAAAGPATDAEKRAALLQAVEARLATLTVPEDLRAALEAIVGQEDASPDHIELGALLLAWGRRDLPPAVQWMEKLGGTDMFPASAAVFEKLGYESDPADILARGGLAVHDGSPFVRGLVRKIFDTMSLDEIKQLARTSIDSDFLGPSDLATQWPADKGMELVDLAVSLERPALIEAHARSLGDNEGILFLHRLLLSDLDPGFLRGVLGKIYSPSYIAKAEGVPPEIRAEVMRHMGDVSGESVESELASFQSRLVGSDLQAFLFPEGEPEPVQAFKTGDTDALALLRDYQQRFPGYHDEKELRSALFRKLATLDPTRAVELLAPFTEVHRRMEVTAVLGRINNDDPPEVTRQLFSLLPLPEDESGLRERFMKWHDRSYSYVDTYGELYREWVEHLPAELDRDLALASIAMRIAKRQPEEAERLRAQISRPDIRSFR